MRERTTSTMRIVGQVSLGAALAFAGVSHLTFQREEFQAQVPPWVPLDPDLVVLASGVVEIALGGALLASWNHPRRARVGAAAAAFFVAVFPGNVAQFTERRDEFGLDSDTSGSCDCCSSLRSWRGRWRRPTPAACSSARADPARSNAEPGASKLAKGGCGKQESGRLGDWDDEVMIIADAHKRVVRHLFDELHLRPGRTCRPPARRRRQPARAATSRRPAGAIRARHVGRPTSASSIAAPWSAA